MRSSSRLKDVNKKHHHRRDSVTKDDDSSVLACGSVPLSTSELKEFTRQANLVKLLKNYRPSQLSQQQHKSSKGKTNNKSKTYTLRKMDIVCGRGNQINKLPGNVLMRLAVGVNQKTYLDLEKGTKSLAGDAMIGFFESWGLRFLELVNPNDEFSQRASFRLSPYTRVHEKVMQALRQKHAKEPTFPKALLVAKNETAKSKATTKKATSTKRETKQTASPPPRVASAVVHPSPRDKRSVSRKSHSLAASSSSSKGNATALSDDDDNNFTRSIMPVVSKGKSPSAVVSPQASAPIVWKGSFEQPVPASVVSLTSFLRTRLQKR